MKLIFEIMNKLSCEPAAPVTAMFLLPPTAQSDLGIQLLPSFARNGREYNNIWDTFTFLLNFEGFTSSGGIRANVQYNHLSVLKMG